MTTTPTEDLTILDGPFSPTWDSLRQFQCPDWFCDGKLAFWSHWGPQSVPMFGDWYARHMYVQGRDQYLHHWRVYGHPSKVGYKDIPPLWKAENFDPHGLMQLFVAAGAKYFVGQAMHHDNFDNFDSAHNPWNSVNVGPKRDIVGLWRDAARAHGLPFGLSEHLGASFNWSAVNKGSDKTGPYAGIPYDGNDPEFASLYYRNQGYSMERGWYEDEEQTRIDPVSGSKHGSRDGWYTSDAEFQRHWFARIKDVIDKYQPDLLYSDGGVPFGEIGLRIIAHLYNTSASRHGSNQAVYNQKDVDPAIYTLGVLDIERGQRENIAELPWQTDTSVGDWFYNVKDVYKTPRQMLETLVDIVSKNGNLLLNIPQRPDGTLDDECDYLLRQMAVWMTDNGEGIFGTRPWDIAGEGAKEGAEGGAFREGAVKWTSEDFRFTRKGDTVYAYQMRQPENGQALIRALASGRTRRVAAVRLLGQGNIAFEQTGEGLQITLPPLTSTEGPHGFAIAQE